MSQDPLDHRIIHDDLAARADAICDRFEAAKLAGQSPSIEDYLGEATEPFRSVLLRELILAELDWRAENGDQPDPKEYFDRFPGAASIVRESFEVLRSDERSTDRGEIGSSAAAASLRGVTHHQHSPPGSVCMPELDAGRDRAIGHNDQGQECASSCGLQIRCPHCHDSVEIALDTPVTEITCSSCGSHFSLVGQGADAFAGGSVTALGHFELVERLGVGGFGTVWKARDTELERTVAIKIPRKSHLEPSEVEHFLREARTAAQLKHPNIVRVHEVGRDGNTIFIVTDLVRGMPLSRWLAQQRISLREAADLCRKIAGALHHAHESGVIHRDLKPSNIIIDVDGEPNLTDFGLARREVGETTMTVDGQVLGTPAYMSPEQAQGESHEADRRTDVYSLGVVLFELLTGELPFRGSARMLIHQVICEDAPSPRKLNGSIPGDLETICLKCLEKEPQRRYSTAAEVSEELGRYLAGQPIRARPITAPGRIWRWCRRNPAISALTGGLIAALLLGLIGVAFQWLRAENEVARANLIARNESLQRRKAEEATDQNRRLLYAAEMIEAQQAWESGNVERAVKLLKRHQPQPGQKYLPGFQWRYLSRLCQRSMNTPILPHNGRVWDIAVSPDGKTLASVGKDNSVTLWDMARGTVQKQLGEPGYVVSVAFSPDGRTLATSACFEDIRLWDVATGKTTVKLLNSRYSFCLTFSPDGKVLASASGAAVQLWNIAKGERLRNLEKHKSDPIWALAFSADGESLASASDREVILWDVETETEPYVLREDLAVGHCVAFSDDGRTLASGSQDGTVWLWGTEKRELQDILRGQPRAAIWSLTFSSDGRLAAGSSDGTVALWDMNTRTEQDVLKGSPETVMSVEFSPDNRMLALASWDKVRIWDVTTRRPSDVLKGHSLEVTTLAFSPDGSVLFSGSCDGTVRIWDVHTAEELTAVPAHDARIMAVAISPDGRTMASASWDDKVKLRDLTTGQLGATYDVSRTPCCVAFSPDGTSLATCGGGPSAGVWDLATGQRRYNTAGFNETGHTDMVTAVAISPSGELLATSSWDKTVRLWELASGTSLRILAGHLAPVKCIAFSRDGRMVGSGAVDNAVMLWDVDTGKPRELEGHAGAVNSVAFSPTENILASGASDRTVRLWYFDRVKEPETLPHNSPVTSVAFSSDGRTLASASDNTVRLWRTAGEDITAEVEPLVTLERRVRTIADADVQERRRTLDDVKAYLATRVAAGLLQRDIILAVSTAHGLQKSDNRNQMVEAFRGFAEVIAESKDEGIRRLAASWQAMAP